MDENVRRVLSEVGPYSDKDSTWSTINIWKPIWKLKVARLDFLGGIPPKFEH